MEVPPSSPAKAHSTAEPSAQCMDARPQAEVADGTATGGVQATTGLSTEDPPIPRKAAKRSARFIEGV
jgi:hypothetical protein